MNELTLSLLSVDGAILRFFQEHIRLAWLNPVIKVITTLGDKGGIWLLAGLILLFFKQYRKQGLTVILCIAACFVLNNIIIKNLVDRTRPYYIFEWLQPIIELPDDASFPSGHACASFAGAYALYKGLGKKYWWVYIVAVIIALSRLYVGVHFPSDVLGGACVGFFVSMIVYRLREKYIILPWEREQNE